MVFEETPLAEVVATINRNYNVSIEVKNKDLNALKISAYFKELSADQVTVNGKTHKVNKKEISND